VTEVNHELDKQPDLANSDPYDKGWFLKTELSDFEADKENLIEAEGYFDAMKKKAGKEHQRLKTKTQNQRKARAQLLYIERLLIFALLLSLHSHILLYKSTRKSYTRR